MVARVKYTPIGDEVSPEASFVQAALALDVAAQLAVESRDTKELNNTASLWIEMAKVLMGIDGEEESAPDRPEKEDLGFRIRDKDENGGIDRPEPTNPSSG